MFAGVPVPCGPALGNSSSSSPRPVAMRGPLQTDPACSVTKDLIGNLYTLARESATPQNEMNQQTFQHLYQQNRSLQQMIEAKAIEWQKALDQSSLDWSRQLLDATKQWEERVNRVQDNFAEQITRLEGVIAKKEQAAQEETSEIRAHFAKEIGTLRNLQERTDRTIHEQSLRIAVTEQELEEAARTKALEESVQTLSRDLHELAQKRAADERAASDSMNRVLTSVQSVHDTFRHDLHVVRDEAATRQKSTEELSASNQKKTDYTLTVLSKDLRAAQELAQKDVEKARDELAAKLHSQHMALDKQVVAVVKDFDLRISRVLEEVQGCEIRTKEGFSNASTDVAQLRSNVLSKFSAEESIREELLRQIREAVDFTNKSLNAKLEDLGGKVDQEQRARNAECSSLGMGIGDLQTKLDETVHELGSFRHQCGIDYVTEKRMLDSCGELTQKILLESSRRVQEGEQISAMVYELKSNVSEMENHSAGRANDLEKFVVGQKQEFVGKCEDLWKEINLGRVSQQKLENLLTQQNSERVKDSEKKRGDIAEVREHCDKSAQQLSSEIEKRLQHQSEFLSAEQQRGEDAVTEKQKRLAEDVRRLQSGLSSEANVRMLDVENVFARMQMLKEEILAQLDSEKRQRMLNEEKLNTDQSQVRRLLQTTGSPTASRLLEKGSAMMSPIRNVTDGSFLFAEANSSWLTGSPHQTRLG
eukprot:g3769.t1